MDKSSTSDFRIGFIAWKDFSPHGFKLIALEDTLNHIKLHTYGNGVKRFNFIPMVLTPNNRVHEEEINYSSRKKELSIQLKLDYQEVINAGLSGFMPLVGQLLLRGIDEAPQTRIKNFDWVRFRKDIQDLLSENAWLLPVEQS